MKKQRDKDAEDLEEDEIRHVVNVLDVFVKAPRSVHRRGVRVHVHEEKSAEWYDARQLVQLAE
jgi:hypothetical protein